MQIRAITVEDEEKSLYVLEEFIRQCAPDIELCGTASHAGNAVTLIESTLPQLVFMDVCIADGTGFDVLQKLTYRNFELILVTAYEQYALDAFRFAAIDYLLKPIGVTEFENAIERVRKRLMEKNRSQSIDTFLSSITRQKEQDKKLSIATLNGFEFIDLRDIVWCKSDSSYTVFYLNNKSRVTSSRNIGYYEDVLSPYNFYRINHGIIVNMQLIRSYIKGKGGYVIMNDGTELEVSQRKRSDFLGRFNI